MNHEIADRPKREDVTVIGQCPRCGKARWTDITSTFFHPDGSVDRTEHRREEGDCTCG